MADKSKIEWTEATWNPITGCSVHSAGCTNCYAMKLAGTRLQHHPSRAGLTVPSKAGPVWTGEVRFNPEWLTQPLTWKRPRMIFVVAHGDLFHENVGEWHLDQIFAVMALASHHKFQVLTKRAKRMRAYFADPNTWGRICAFVEKLKPSALWNGNVYQAKYEITGNGFLPNVWLGVSVENQAAADERIPDLLATPSALRWLSCEPLLGPVDLTAISTWQYPRAENVDSLSGELSGMFGDPAGFTNKIDWVVAGGESGSQCARPMHPDWARSLRDQCAAADVPFFFKQWGEWLPGDEDENHVWLDSAHYVEKAEKSTRLYAFCYIDLDGTKIDFEGDDADAEAKFDASVLPSGMVKFGKKAAGRLLDGVLHDGMPS